jgi:hypothetical protein
MSKLTLRYLKGSFRFESVEIRKTGACPAIQAPQSMRSAPIVCPGAVRRAIAARLP